MESIRFGKLYFNGNLYRKLLTSEGVYDHVNKKCIYFEKREEHTAICLERYQPTKKQFDIIMKQGMFIEDDKENE